MRKVIIVVIVMGFMLSLSLPTLVAATAANSAIELVESGEAAILIEATTGTVLYEKNANVELEPASMTKMMAMYLVLEAITNGQLAWDKLVSVSEHAASLGGTQIFLEPGEQMSVSDLFKSVAIASANDATTALGEVLAGSEEAFVNLMNERALEFGMLKTTFKNPTGLPEAGHLTTASDMAILAQRLIMDFPEITEFTATYEDYVRQASDEPFWLVNTNKLIRYVAGVDGLKTGFTSSAGYCLAATAKRDEMRVIAVVMGAESSVLRNKEVTLLIEHAFSQYELHQVVEAGSVVGTYKNLLVAGHEFEIVTTSAVNLLTKVGTLRGNESQELVLNQEIALPIKPGDVIGSLVYYVDEKPYQEVTLTVSEPVERTTLIALFMEIVSRLLVGAH